MDVYRRLAPGGRVPANGVWLSDDEVFEATSTVAPFVLILRSRLLLLGRLLVKGRDTLKANGVIIILCKQEDKRACVGS